MNDIHTATGLIVPDGMTLQELPLDDGTLQFWGEFLDREESGSADDSRWTELNLYRIIDDDPSHDSSLPAKDENRDMYGRQMWLLYTIAHSLVYHSRNGCGRGVRMKVSDLVTREIDPEGLEACERCCPSPVLDAFPEAEFRIEIPLHFYTPCQNAQKLMRSLWRDPRCENCHDRAHEDGRCRKCGCDHYVEARRTLSIPGRNLLERVAQQDPGIAAAMTTTKRL